VKIGIQTWGSEGDIRPFLALGHALAERGHAVELLYTEIGERRYEAVAEALGFTARAVASPVIADRDELFAIGLAAINAANEFTQGLQICRRLLDPVVEPIFEAGLDLARRSDLLVHHLILHPAAAAAEIARIPAVTLAFAHMLVPSRHIHPSGFPDFGAWSNRLGWTTARVALNLTLLRTVNRFRRQHGLAPCRDLLDDAWASHRLHLIASSPAWLERPADWPAWNQMCGFLSLPVHEHEALAPEVEAFLSAGPAPIFMGFGSLMPTSGPHLTDTLAIFEEAVRLSGCRAIIQAEVEPTMAPDILYVRRTPHRVVFPRCAAVVHHAGAGTTHTTLAAGVPSVPVPHVSDQYGWADELHRLGAGATPVRRTKLTAKALAGRMAEVAGNAAMKAAAANIQSRMANDNGPLTAAVMIERAVGAVLD
jgi:sterol 3beta-glucosyltransferase/vancomycin aglycone glucosyltransferase